jgi:hypothetical protein
MRVRGSLLAVLVAALGLTACSTIVVAEQPADEQSLTLQAGGRLGQTFVARRAGLSGVEIFLAPEAPGGGEIRFGLRAGPQSPPVLAEARLPLAQVTTPGFYRFQFAPQAESNQRDYYAVIEVAGPGRVRVGGAPGPSYLDGALYQNDSAADAQMTFRLVYEPSAGWAGLAREAVNWAGMLGAGALLYLLPGWALLLMLWPSTAPLAGPERVVLAASLSLAFYPLLFLWTHLVGLRFGPWYAWLPVVGSLAVVIWRGRVWRPAEWCVSWREWLQPEILWPGVALAVVTGLIFGARFLVIRNLDAPLWGDSYQHTLIAQLLLDHGGLFDAWEPYTELQSFTYHFGFHSAIAVLCWVTGLGAVPATLWTGQILNGLAALALYPLAARLGGNRWAGVGAVMLAGLLSPMPMFYVNWGRYTQLAGQVILPGAVYLLWAWLEAPGQNWRWLALIWIAMAGLALTHYRVFVFAALFLAAFFSLEARRGRVRALTAKLFWLAGGTGVLFAPWLAHTFAGKLTEISTQQMTTPVQATPAWVQQYNSIGNLFTYLPPLVWVLFPVGLGWGLWRRQKGIALAGLWWLGLLVIANPQWFHLPGEGVISNFAVFIAAYIPAGVVEGAALGWLIGERGRRTAPALGLALMTMVLGFMSVRPRLADLNVTAAALAARPDLRAAEWIRANTPETARFLINSAFAYEDSVIFGTDGGWWLPVLARRPVTVPPLNYELEQGSRPGYVAWVNALSAAIQAQGIDAPDVLAQLRERGVTHVYLGQRHGPALDPQQLLASPHFRLVYHQDRVWIFAVRN